MYSGLARTSTLDGSLKLEERAVGQGCRSRVQGGLAYSFISFGNHHPRDQLTIAE